MGKRKSSKKPEPKKKNKLAVSFTCVFCNGADSVHCEIDRDNRVGEVKCALCGERFSTKVHDLSEPIDVYSDWVDACEAANAEEAEKQD